MSSEPDQNEVPREPGRLHRAVFWICSALSLGGIVAIMLLLSVSNRHLESLTHQSHDNTTWIVAQIEIELHRLRKSLMDLDGGRTSMEVTELRLDIFVSRILLLESPVLVELHPRSVTEPLQERLYDLVQDVEIYLDGARGPAALNDILERFDDIDRVVHDFSVVTTQKVAEQRTAQAAAVELAQSHTRSTLTVVLALLIFLVGWLLWQRRLLQSLVHQLRTSADKLSRTAREAQAANTAKSHFLASMSHELRTPLNAIIGFSDLMQQEPWGPLGNDRYRGYSSDILQAGRHLLSLVNDVLDLAKVESGRFELFEEEVDLAEEIALAAAFVQPAADKAQVTIDAKTAGALPLIQADGRRLRQVLVNLIANAVRFSNQDATVTVRAKHRSDGAVAITIRDTGPGMSADELAEAFKPFAQVTSDAHKARDGTGLGLPLSKYLVEAHGGALVLDSRPGLGTEATVVLPPWRAIGARREPAPASRPERERVDSL